MRFLVLLQVFLSGCAVKHSPAPVEEPVVVEEVVPAEEPGLLHPHGLGPWRLGMSRFDVLQLGGCARFEPVRVTGGFECPYWDSPLGKRKISFVFNKDYRLEKIQLWLFEGPEVPGDREAWSTQTWESFQELRSRGAWSSETHAALLSMGREDFVAALVEGTQDDIPFSANFELQSGPAESGRQWISIISSPQGYYSFLFVAR